ncbi:hypothetical protein [Spirillospora sp. NBC_01491]|uniref:hypothetical protein n=1 Tax=Spirillospora sp. NBC_01491 TaxID=2976007 RepID=UPI002E320273|nr:hypothetical protein [Spirillospora sp. NBC_01491]
MSPIPAPESHPALSGVPEGRTALRDRIAEALYQWTVKQAAGGPFRLLPRDERVLRENSLARADAVTPIVEELLAELGPEIADADATFAQMQASQAQIDRLRRQVRTYRGLKDVYLRERNAAHAELIKAEDLIERLCDDREAGQRVVKAALTEQRQRAEEAEDRLRVSTQAYEQLADRHADAEATRDRWQKRAEAAERDFATLGNLYVSACKGRQALEQRAEKAEADLARRAREWQDEQAARIAAEQATIAAQAAVQRVKALAADMRTWCSPHGIAPDYAKRIEEALDQKETR